MKKWLYILAAILLQIQFVSCMDEQLVDGSYESDMTSLKIVLDIPVENAQSRGLVYGPDEDEANVYESEINDIYAFAFDSDNKCVDKFKTVYSSGTLTATINLEKTAADKPITVMVITNLKNQENGDELVSKLNGMEGKTKEQVLKELEYTFSGAWNITERQLPMWGETKITPQKGKTVFGDVKLYRAVSKINVTVNKGKRIQDSGTDIFKLRSVRVYYARTSGLAGSFYAPGDNEPDNPTIGSPTITQTSMPDGVEYMPRYTAEQEPNGIQFTVDKGNDYALENKIYVPEVNQQGEEPMCLVIGGCYMGSTEETYYRVDFKKGNKGDEYYDALRNHIYNFDITNVKRPGTDIPDPALDHVVVGMDVKITEWETEFMRGIGGQYTLEVQGGGVIMDATNEQGTSLWVKTTYNGGWKVGSQVGDWYTVEKDGDKVKIVPNLNQGGQRRGSFVITSGNLNKTIMVRQRGKGTANCYIVSDNGRQMVQDLVVTVKGNGEEGLIADGKPLDEKEPNMAPAYAKVIWETAEGLVQLQNVVDGKAQVNENGIVQYAIDLDKQNTDLNIKGGNALIGAFDAENHLLWSWHLWVCPELDTNGDGYIKYKVNDEESDDESNDNSEPFFQEWSTGYTFMDRNLGALSNKPGLASLGLLYQWGRKDPFIGVGKIEENAKTMDTKNLTGFSWQTSGSALSVEEARTAPTTLSKEALTGIDYALLWGTDKGFTSNGERDAGNKTIYDPCPVGYRVPPVGSVVFTDGNSSSEKENWDKNNIYWPYLQDLGTSEDGRYKTGASSYGFWLNRIAGDSKPEGVPYYPSNAESVENAAWLPISGVYDGDMTKFALVDGQWSVTVNSIIWTNSSIKAKVTENGVKVEKTRPGALFLHGTEDWRTGLGLSHNAEKSGRHIHKLIEEEKDLYAKPSHAGSVRCIRDTKSTTEGLIKTPINVTLGSKEGSISPATLVSITESWEVVNPGASWFTMTPDEGGAGSSQTITFTATKENTTGKEREATLTVKFSDGTQKKIKVVQKSKPVYVSENYLTFAGYGDKAEGRPAAQKVGIAPNLTWNAKSDMDWMKIASFDGGDMTYRPTLDQLIASNGYIFIRLDKNDSGATRTGTITFKMGDGTTETITVTQGVDKE